MSNIVNMFESSVFPEGYGEADFEVSTAIPYYHAVLNDGSDVEIAQNKKKVYFRTDTGDELGTHGQRYKPVHHKDMIDSTRSILKRSSLNLEGLEETITVGENGAVCFVKHLLPEHQITTPDGDTGELTFLAVNAYNSKMAYWQSVGLRQSACLNGQVFTTGAASVYKNRHTMSLNLEHAAKIISNVVGILDKENEIWHRWAKMPTSSAQMFPIFARAAGSKKALDCIEAGDDMFSILSHEPAVKNNKALNYMLTKWSQDYAPKMGQNLWAAYNTLTDWSTHFTPETTKRTPVNDMPMISYKNSETVRNIVSDTSLFKMAA